MAEAPPAAAGFDIRRMLLLGGVSVVVIFAVLFFLFRGCAPAVRGPNYTVIYSNLELKDAANAIARLKELAIPYEIREEGRAIAVPKDKADQARLGLAEENLPAGGVVGWEIFDEARLGATDFDRRIQLIRAISGELSRTIRRIQAVEDARVQIVLPETRLFAETVAPVTASVMLRLKPGADLSAGKINGIVHLVASSVENLQPENVTVVDSTGRILTAKAVPMPVEVVSVPRELLPPPLPEIVVTPEAITTTTMTIKVSPEAAPGVRPLTAEEKILIMVQAKKELETNLSGKAQEILNRFYPPNSAIVRVNVELKNSNKGKEFIKSKLSIGKITAIILVDNRVDITKTLKESTFKAVAAAIGYNRKRGDRIVLQKVPFHLATPPPEIIRGEVEKALPPRPRVEMPALPALPAGWLRNTLWLLGGLGGFFIIVMIFRLFRRPGQRPEAARAERRAAAPRPAEPISREKMMAIESIKSAAERNPERMAEMLRNWLTE
jgi:flagellar biosynthesis/type III secretory pathway M-ring protein FliF/YscJ